MNELESIVERIESGVLLPASMLRLSIDEALTLRERPDFAKPWNRVQTKMDKAIRQAKLPVRARHDLAMLREVAFIRVYDFTEHSELAGTVSDDFGLIGGALVTSTNDDWLNGLWYEYHQGRFPCCKVQSVPGPLRKLLRLEPESPPQEVPQSETPQSETPQSETPQSETPQSETPRPELPQPPLRARGD